MSFKVFTYKRFRNRLFKLISEIENSSLVEVVVIAKPQSYHYNDIYLWVSFVGMLLVFSYMMFASILIDMYLIYIYTIISFPLIYLLLHIFPGLGRIFISKKRKSRNVEIFARAIFQKAGIRYTNERIGVLFYISYFEKMVYVIPDRGAYMKLPDNLWKEISEEMNKIFKSGRPQEKFLEVLSRTKATFAKYIPPIENDINELPDNIKVEL